MADIVLTAATGRPIGTRPAKRLRAAGKVPGVLYGGGKGSLPVTVDWRELRGALTTEAGMNALITLEADGDRQLTIVKDLQRDHVHRSVTHVDFIRIDTETAIEVDVPIVLDGEPEKVYREDGMVDHTLFTLLVSAKPGSIPNELTVDVSEMEIGDTIRVSDLRLPAGVATDLDPEEPVASAMVTRATIEVAEEEEMAEALDELAEAEAEGGEEGEAGAASDEGSGDGS